MKTLTWGNGIHRNEINRHITLRRRHIERDGAHDCLLNRLFRDRSKKASKFRVTGLCEGNSPVTGEFPAQRCSNAENVSIWWRHHEFILDSRQRWHLEHLRREAESLLYFATLLRKMDTWKYFPRLSVMKKISLKSCWCYYIQNHVHWHTRIDDTKMHHIYLYRLHLNITAVMNIYLTVHQLSFILRTKEL